MPDLSDRPEPELARLARLVAAIREYTSASFFVVGARARDLVLHYQHGIPLQRATYDVDFALAMSDWRAFHALQSALIGRCGFESTGSKQRLRHRELGDVDLVPFGDVESADGELRWPPDGDPVMNVLGFREALETSLVFVLPGGAAVRVVSPALMALLKVLAWADRGGRVPRKDANDLFLLMRVHGEAGNSERVFEDAQSVLGRYDYEELGAWLLGRDAREAIRSCATARPGLRVAVASIVERECEPDGPLRLVGDAEGGSPARRLALLCAFRDGFARDA